MSDPVSNIEIEDVLSSIRRLVAETDRPMARPAAGPGERDQQGAERLVLTPALRVTDPVLRLSPQEAAPPDAAPPDAAPPLAARAAVLEAALSDSPDDWEPDGSEAQPVMDWSAPAPDDPPVQPARSDAAPVRLTDPALTEDETPVAEDDVALADDLEQTISGALADRLAAATGTPGLDEATLRALVTEVVRDELQGALGERITRNVRKLVRREIFRVLSSQEFD